MNESELVRLEQELRSTVNEYGQGWILEEVDSAVAAGVSEEKILRSRTKRKGTADQATSPTSAAEMYEVLGLHQINEDEYETSRKGGSLVITTRVMTDRERVRLLLEALRRVLVELPGIEADTTDILQTAPDTDVGDRAAVHGVRFELTESDLRQEGFQLRGDRFPATRRREVGRLVNTIIKSNL